MDGRKDVKTVYPLNTVCKGGLKNVLVLTHLIVLINFCTKSCTTREFVEPMDAPKRYAIMECVAW